jgi:hypothetical protein
VFCDVEGCKRMICTSRCVKLKPPMNELHKYYFVCPTCHNDYYHKLSSSEPKPYFVRSFLCVSPCPRLSSFFQGLYETLIMNGKEADLGSSKPAFPKDPAELFGVFHLSFATKVSPDFNDCNHFIHVVQLEHAQFIILHFVYHSIDTAGSPARAVYQHLRGFFKKPNALIYKEISFNVPEKEDIRVHADGMRVVANELMK